MPISIDCFVNKIALLDRKVIQNTYRKGYCFLNENYYLLSILNQKYLVESNTSNFQNTVQSLSIKCYFVEVYTQLAKYLA